MERIASTQHDDEYVGRVDVGHLLVLDVVLVLLLLLGVMLSFYLTFNLMLNIFEAHYTIFAIRDILLDHLFINYCVRCDSSITTSASRQVNKNKYADLYTRNRFPPVTHRQQTNPCSVNFAPLPPKSAAQLP